MSKVQTLLKVIEYQKQRPGATDADISYAVGISERYVRQCRKDIRELSFHLSKLSLENNETDLLMSKLSPSIGYEQAILGKLQATRLEQKDGIIRIASSEDKASKEYLQIGLWSPQGSKEHSHFWIKRLLYEPLLRVEGEEKIDYRLASICENMKGYSRWRVKLKKDLQWSDGKPITSEDVIYTLAKDKSLAMREVKKVSGEEILLSLSGDDVLLPYKLGHIPITPSHSPTYNVTSGPFILKKNKTPSLFHLYNNEDYYRANYPKIDWISLKSFKRSAFAVKAVMEKKLDLFPVRSVRQIRHWSSISPQSFLLKGLSYYLLLINHRKSGCLKDKSKLDQLGNLIDYNAINMCLSGTLPKEIHVKCDLKRKIDLRIGYLGEMNTQLLRCLTSAVASSLGLDASNVVNMNDYSSESIMEEIDILLTQIYFGYGHARLKNYFHSKGQHNIFAFSNIETDSLIDQLDRTVSMSDRELIGQEVIQKLQKENAIILLAPCFEYILSNLYIVPHPSLNSLSELVFNLPNIRVERKKVVLQG